MKPEFRDGLVEVDASRGARDRHVPFTLHLGIQLERAAGGEAVVAMTLEPEFLNHLGVGHGGVVMTLLDVAMANAALSRVDYAREVVTIDVHVAFMRPTTGRLVATGRATGGGKSVCFCEGRVVDGSGDVAAQAMATFRYRDVE